MNLLGMAVVVGLTGFIGVGTLNVTNSVMSSIKQTELINNVKEIQSAMQEYSSSNCMSTPYDMYGNSISNSPNACVQINGNSSYTFNGWPNSVNDLVKNGFLPKTFSPISGANISVGGNTTWAIQAGYPQRAYSGYITVFMPKSIVNSQGQCNSVANKIQGGTCIGNEMGPYVLSIAVYRGMSSGWEKVNNGAFNAN